jgi:hypothetical protein
MPSPLELATADLDRQTVAGLGDTFTYTAAGGSPVTGVLGFVDYGEDNANPDPRAAGAIAQVIVIELLIEKAPVRPSDACRISNLSLYPGKLWKPIGVVASDSGFWRFGIQKVPV